MVSWNAATCLTFEPVTYCMRSMQCTPMSIMAPPPPFFLLCRQLPGISGYQQVNCEYPDTTWPILPSAIAFFIACT